jgi:hypothetical protein
MRGGGGSFGGGGGGGGGGTPWNNPDKNPAGDTTIKTKASTVAAADKVADECVKKNGEDKCKAEIDNAIRVREDKELADLQKEVDSKCGKNAENMSSECLDATQKLIDAKADKEPPKDGAVLKKNNEDNKCVTYREKGSNQIFIDGSGIDFIEMKSLSGKVYNIMYPKGLMSDAVRNMLEDSGKKGECTLFKPGIIKIKYVKGVECCLDSASKGKTTCSKKSAERNGPLYLVGGSKGDIPKFSADSCQGLDTNQQIEANGGKLPDIKYNPQSPAFPQENTFEGGDSKGIFNNGTFYPSI